MSDLERFADAMQVLDEEATEVEVWQGNLRVAGTSGPNAWREAFRYGLGYAQDGPVTIRVVRRETILTVEPGCS